MGRPRKSVRPASFSIDAKMYKLLQELAEKEKYTMSHIVNMALYDYKPISELDIYRDYWKCDQRDCAVLNPPGTEKCKNCSQRSLQSIIKEHNDRMLKYK
jgi:hypothetical protein